MKTNVYCSQIQKNIGHCQWLCCAIMGSPVCNAYICFIPSFMLVNSPKKGKKKLVNMMWSSSFYDHHDACSPTFFIFFARQKKLSLLERYQRQRRKAEISDQGNGNFKQKLHCAHWSVSLLGPPSFYKHWGLINKSLVLLLPSLLIYL